MLSSSRGFQRSAALPHERQPFSNIWLLIRSWLSASEGVLRCFGHHTLCAFCCASSTSPTYVVTGVSAAIVAPTWHQRTLPVSSGMASARVFVRAVGASSAAAAAAAVGSLAGLLPGYRHQALAKLEEPSAEEGEPARIGLYVPAKARLALNGGPLNAGDGALEHARLIVHLLHRDEAKDGMVDVIALASTEKVQTALIRPPAEVAFERYPCVVLSSPLEPEIAEQTAVDLWRALESHGELTVQRRKTDGRPMAAQLRAGKTTWSGVVARSSGDPLWGAEVRAWAPGVGQRQVMLSLPYVACDVESWAGGECVYECGFCKFMKGGPCREEFIRWEACVDRCRETKEDFIELCSKQTLALKYCTDEHPEYYGSLMSEEGRDGDSDGDGEGVAAPPAQQ